MRRALLLSPLLAFACADPPPAGDDASTSTTDAAETGAPTTGGETGSEAGETGETGETGSETGVDPGGAAAHCVYDNPFSQQEECREYVGDGWTAEAIAADCAEAGGTAGAGACDYPSTLGTCTMPGEPDAYVVLVFPGDDAALCQAMKTGCELFAGGTFAPSAVCEEGGGPDPDANVFEWPALQCLDPLEGEPPGMGEGGQVCTWTMISGCTEPGRKFADYGACETVLTQRPYHPVPPPPPPAEPDPRLDDPAYVEEAAWVREQVEACACVCCHQTSVTPEGASVWDIEAPGNWLNSFSPYGLAFAGGFIDSSLLGAYPAAENNGFARETTGLPSTDAARMAAFFAAELEHRGLSPADFAGQDPTPKIFHDQAIFEPGPCAGGEGVAADGTITWSGGWARYVYVLEQSAANPGVPPNLDRPDGTLWRLDVPSDDAPIASGEVRYGELPPGKTQGFPEAGDPPPLQDGATYHLYVLADIGVPISRCLFTY